MKKYFLIIVFLFLFCLVPIKSLMADSSLEVVINEIARPVKAVYAANGLKMGTIIINEVAWMGTANSVNDEWIELYNKTEGLINFDGWRLVSQDGTPEINLSGTIPANGFYLLERTDDTTVPDIPADQIYTGALGNGGEALDLYDNFSNLIDGTDNSNGWLAGDNKTKQTMERKADGNWQTSQNPGGTPKTKNGILIEASQPAPAIEPAEEDSEPAVDDSLQQPLPQPQQPVAYPVGIVINEILPSPEGPDAEEEWIEIFNQNNFEVDLSGWRIADTDGKTTIFTFPTGTRILPHGFLILSRPTTKITLNNEGDGLKLSQPQGNVVDEINYQKAIRGQSYFRRNQGSEERSDEGSYFRRNQGSAEQSEAGSYNRIDSKFSWSTILTPGIANIIPSQKEKEGKPNTETEKIEIKTPELKEKAAAGGEKIERRTASPPLIALTIAVFSGAIIFFLKKGVKVLHYLKN